MNIIKHTAPLTAWKTYSIVWNDKEDLHLCDSCMKSTTFREGFLIKSSRNRFICNECAIKVTPKVAEVLFAHRLHENPNDEDAASYLTDIKRLKTELETKPPAVSKETLRQIHELTNSVKVLIWGEDLNDIHPVTFLVPTKWLLQNEEAFASIFHSQTTDDKFIFIQQASGSLTSAHMYQLYEKALSEGAVIATYTE